MLLLFTVTEQRQIKNVKWTFFGTYGLGLKAYLSTWVVYGIKQIADGKKGDLAEYSSAIGEFRPF